VYNPKYLFNSGFGVLGVLSLGAGFVRNKIALIVLRAFTGIAAAITIPSALNLIVHLFPHPAEQARAIGIFGSVAALGNGE
jgi:MFS family permease